jgi:hypothetical protein
MEGVINNRYWWACLSPSILRPRVIVSTTKNIHFVKLSKYVTDITIVFLSSRWLKNIYGTSNLGSRWESYASEKISVWTTGTTGPRSLVLPVREGLTQIWTTGTTGPRPVLPMDGGRWRSLAWKWTTGTSGGAWPEVPVGVYSESDFQISKLRKLSHPVS